MNSFDKTKFLFTDSLITDELLMINTFQCLLWIVYGFYTGRRSSSYVICHWWNHGANVLMKGGKELSMRGNQHSRQRKKNPIVFLVLQLRCETRFTTVYRVSCTVYQILNLFRETRAAFCFCNGRSGIPQLVDKCKCCILIGFASTRGLLLKVIE